MKVEEDNKNTETSLNRAYQMLQHRQREKSHCKLRVCIRITYSHSIPHVKHRCLFLLNENIIQLYTYECIKSALRLNGNVRSVLSFLSSRARNIALLCRNMVYNISLQIQYSQNAFFFTRNRDKMLLRSFV